MSFLRIISGPQSGAKFQLGPRTVTVGRDPSHPIQIVDELVSRHHARIRCDNDRYFIEDLRSANGTMVNGQRILQPQMLRRGDRLTIGRVHFEFETEPPAPAPQAATAGNSDATSKRSVLQTTTQRQVMSVEMRVVMLLDQLDCLDPSMLSAEQLYERMLPAMIDLLEIDRVVVLLPVAGTGKLRSAAFIERHPPLAGESRLPLNAAVVRNSVAAADVVCSGSNLSASDPASTIRFAACAPLDAKQARAGVLYVDRTGLHAQGFADEQAQLLRFLANRLAAAATRPLAAP